MSLRRGCQRTVIKNNFGPLHDQRNAIIAIQFKADRLQMIIVAKKYICEVDVKSHTDNDGRATCKLQQSNLHQQHHSKNLFPSFTRCLYQEGEGE